LIPSQFVLKGCGFELIREHSATEAAQISGHFKGAVKAAEVSSSWSQETCL
jgi:hypothetical protein